MISDRDLVGIGAFLIAMGILGLIIGAIWQNSPFAEYPYALAGLVACGVFLLILRLSSNTYLRLIGVCATTFVGGLLPIVAETSTWIPKMFGLGAVAAGTCGLIIFSSMKKGESDETRTLLKIRMLLLGPVSCAVGILAVLSGDSVLWWFGLGLLLGGVGATILGLIVPKEFNCDLSSFKNND